MDSNHCRPPGTDDATVAAVGKLSEAFERLERARGHLYEFHQLEGRVDLMMAEAAEMLRHAGHDELAERVEREIVGRDVLDGQWTFQIVEEFDDRYYRPAQTVEEAVRHQLMAGRRHVHEAEMKAQRRAEHAARQTHRQTHPHQTEQTEQRGRAT